MSRSVNWKQVEEMCYDLSELIKKDNYNPDVLLGIARGGLGPLLMLSYSLDVRNIATVPLEFYDKNKQAKNKVKQLMTFDIKNLKKYKKILVVDDVADTGQTLDYILSKLKNKGVEVKTSTLLYKPKKSKIKPDYYVKETDEWIDFPWGD